MKGYLARLASRAAGHGSAIHPLLGTTVGPGDTQPEGAETTEFPSAHPVPPATPGERIATGFVPPSAPGRGLTVEPAPEHPPAPEGPPMKVENQMSSETVPPVRSPERISLPTIKPRASETRSSEQSVSAAPTPVLVPPENHAITNLIAREQPNPPASKPGAERDAPHNSLGTRRDRAPVRQRLSEGPASDEIQIHIGRVEVWAAQPAPARAPATKAPRKAPPLSEYLRQRNGRSS